MIQALLQFFAPLRLALRSKADMVLLLRDLGWDVQLSDAQYGTLVTIFDFVSEIEALASDPDLDDAVQNSQSLFRDIQDLASRDAAEIASLPAPLDDRSSWSDLALALPEYLLANWLYVQLPFVYETLFFLTVIEETDRGDELPPHRQLDWHRLGPALDDPVALLKEFYDWGGDLQHAELMERVARYALELGFESKAVPLSDSTISAFYPAAPAEEVKEIVLPLFDGWVLDRSTFFGASLLLAPVPRNASQQQIHGFVLSNQVEGNFTGKAQIFDGWSLTGEAAGDLDGALGVMVQPEGSSRVSPGNAVDARVGIEGAPAAPWVLVGNAEGARLELSQVTAEVAVQGDATNPELLLSAGTYGSGGPGVKLVIAPGDGDSFLTEVLGGDDLAILGDLGFTWSSKTGFQLDGGAGFEVTIPVHRAAGPLWIESMRLALTGGSEGAQVEAAVTGGLDVSVLAVVVDDVGIRAKVTPLAAGETSGVLGTLDLTLEFKPPKGLGLAIDASGLVTGGGYLEHDEAKAQYAGVAEVELFELGLSAVGVLTTRMPNGEDGWSLFLSVFSEFQSIPLGFGFNLEAVGGLIGIHRALDDDALRERMLQGALDSVMFPDDPIANAPAILDDIEAIFPPVHGQFVFGAMMKIGWGRPALLTVDLGVMIELPDPIRIALMGQLESIVPTKELAVLELHMDVFGLIDLTNGEIALDATLRDSQIVGLLTLSGSMAMRAEVLDQPNLLLSVGGSHPDFKKPAGFPSLQRMSASLPLGAVASVELSAYVAFTSNTFQIGGRVDVWVSFVGFTAEGYAGLDALIQFAPFEFQVGAGFGMTVRAGKVTLMGVDVFADVRGPGRWELAGTATFEILKLKKKIKLDITVGSQKQNIAEKYEVLQLLVEALEDPAAWSVTVIGETGAGPVRLREREPEEGEAVHPSGQVEVVQKVAPLNAEIEVFGGGKVSGPKLYEIEKVLTGGDETAPTEEMYVQDWFAPAHFFEMKNQEKVAAPSFERMDGGIRFGSTDIEADDPLEMDLGYEEIYLDPTLNQRRREKRAKGPLEADLLFKVRQFDAAGRAHRGRLRRGKVEPQFEVLEQTFAPFDVETGAVTADIAGQRGTTFAEMSRSVREANAASLADLGNLVVRPLVVDRSPK